MRSLIVLFCVAFIVEAQQNPGCLKDWSYFAKSNKCFKVFGGEFDSIRPTTWSNAEIYCNTFRDGHLASFHSEDELLFVIELSQQAPWDDGAYAPVHIGHTYIGSNKWEWTDGSRWTYTKWFSLHEIGNSPNIQTQSPRGLLHTRQYASSTMWMGSGSDSWAFVCQMPPSNEG